MTDDALIIRLGGEDRELKFRLSAMDVAQTRFGVRMPIAELASITIPDLINIIWIGLLPDYPRLPKSTVIRWIEEDPDWDFGEHLKDIVDHYGESLRMKRVEPDDEDDTGEVKSIEEMVDDPLE